MTSIFTVTNKEYILCTIYQKKHPIIKLPNFFQQQFVPDYMKDNKYWVKRKKNNESAKMSREAQRIKGDLFLPCHKNKN